MKKFAHQNGFSITIEEEKPKPVVKSFVITKVSILDSINLINFCSLGNAWWAAKAWSTQILEEYVCSSSIGDT